MIGRVTWGTPTGRFVATLNDDRMWTVAGFPKEMAESLAESLAGLYADWPAGPEHGPFGPSLLADLAERVVGTVELEPKAKPPADPGPRVVAEYLRMKAERPAVPEPPVIY